MTLRSLSCSAQGSAINPSWWLLMAGMVLFWSDMVQSETLDFYHAVVRYSYIDKTNGEEISGPRIDGTYGLGNKPETEIGRLIHVQTSQGYNNGCRVPVNAPHDTKWIALIQRGGCKFNDKVYHNAVIHNATAVIVYNNEADDILITMQHDYVEDIVSVFLRKEDGESLAQLIDAGHQVKINITVGHILHQSYNTSTHGVDEPSRGKNNVLLATSLCFIVLLIFGLIGLLVYAVRRSKYIQSKNRTSMVFTLQETALAQETLLNVESHLITDRPDVTLP
jgi:hypothetical protein